MTRDNDDNILQLMKGKNDPELEKEFIRRLGETVAGILTRQGILHNRIGICGWDYARAEEGFYNVFFQLTDGMVEIMPSVAPEIAAEYGKAYREKLAALVGEYGRDFDAWPEDGLQRLAGESFLVLSVIPDRIRKSKAHFYMAVGLALKEWRHMIRELRERALILDEAPILLSTSTREEPLWEYMSEYFCRWIISPGCWKTARDRRIGLYCGIFEGFIDAATQYFEKAHLEMPHKCLISLFWNGESESLKELAPSPARDASLAIAGDLFCPGKDVLFVVVFDLEEKAGGMRVAGYGPFAFDSFRLMETTDVLKLAENSRPIWEKIVPEEEFGTLVENSPCAEYEDIGALDASAQKLACEFLNVLGVKEPRGQD